MSNTAAFAEPERRREDGARAEWQQRVEADLSAMKAELADNTRATKAVAQQISTLETKTTPVVEAFGSMQAGIRTIGTIGRWGGRFGKAALWIMGTWVALGIIFKGGTWAEAAAAFWTTLGGAK